MKKIKAISFILIAICSISFFGMTTVCAAVTKQSVPYLNEFSMAGYVPSGTDGWTVQNPDDSTISVANGRLTVSGSDAKKIVNNRAVFLDFEPISSGVVVLEMDLYTPTTPGFNANLGLFDCYDSDGKQVTFLRLNGRGFPATYINDWSDSNNLVSNHLSWGSNGNLYHHLRIEVDFENHVWRAWQGATGTEGGEITNTRQYISKGQVSDFPFFTTDAKDIARVKIAMTCEAQYIDNLKIYQKVEAEQTQNRYSLQVGENKQAGISYKPAGAVISDWVWESQDESVVTVNQNGLMCAKAVGITKVYAKSVMYGFSFCYDVQVSKQAEDITIDQSAAILFVGETKQLSCSPVPHGALTGAIEWSSSNQGVATVNRDGVVTGVSAGTAVISARSEYGGCASYEIRIEQMDDSNSAIYISNADFDSKYLSATGWIPVSQDSNGVAPQWVSGGVDSKDGCIKLVNKAYAQHYFDGLKEGERYTLSFWLKADSYEDGSFATVDIGYQGWHFAKWKTFYDEHSTWQKKTFDFVMPKNAGRPSVLLRLSGPGEVYFDHIRVINQKTPTELSLYSDGLRLNSVVKNAPLLRSNLHYMPKTAGESKLLTVYENNGRFASMSPISSATEGASADIENLIDVSKLKEDSGVSVLAWDSVAGMKPEQQKSVLFSKNKTKMSSVFDFFVTNRMRGIYGGPADMYDEKLHNLIDIYGLNTYLFNIIGTHYGGNICKDMDALDRVLDDAEALAEEKGIKIFPKISYGANATVSNTAYGAFHPGSAHNLSLPCPRAKEYWKAQVTDVLSVVAKHKKLTGAVVDLEMYSGGKTSYGSPCFCDRCVADFDAACNQQLSLIAAENRNAYTKENGLYAMYQNWHSMEITKITSEVRKTLHAINPDLIIGYMPQSEWIGGVSQGLGTGEMPAVVFNENEYKGRIDYMYGIQEINRIADLPTVHATGLWSNENEAISAENFAAYAQEAAENSMGYWIYSTSEMFSSENPQAYYDALKQANDALDTKYGIQ